MPGVNMITGSSRPANGLARPLPSSHSGSATSQARPQAITMKIVTAVQGTRSGTSAFDWWGAALWSLWIGALIQSTLATAAPPDIPHQAEYGRDHLAKAALWSLRGY